MMRKAVIIQVYGRVQGVGFRYYTEKKALELDIAGFVQNKGDGSVYIEAEGDEIQLEQFADWCKTGPRWANVRECRISEMPPLEIKGFNVR
jgi:acylphosphatase